MKALISRELKSVFCSPASAFFSVVYLLVTGGLLWFFSGSYNLIDSGYADMERFFGLSAILFAILIPALTMRLFAEEKKNKTFDILLTRPVYLSSVYFSKFLATFLLVFVTLLPTLIYVYSISQLANPVGNLDVGSIAASYISLLLLVCVFIAIGLFGSAITKNQIIALIVSITLCLFSFFGFELLSGLFLSGKTNVLLSSLGLSYHYRDMQRGIVQISDIIVAINYFILFSVLTLFVLSKNKKSLIISFLVIILLNIITFLLPNYRFDFTADKRYTLNKYSIDLLQNTSKQPLEVEIFLSGELNSGFQRLLNETDNLISNFNRYADNNITVSHISPYQEGVSGDEIYRRMHEQGMSGIVLNEMDREGKASRKIIYPYARITNGKDTLTVSLLKNIMGNTAEENLNASVEALEYEFIDAIKLLQQNMPKNIAFIEGHDELPRVYLYDAEEILSKYYSINRGQIGNEPGIMDGFDAIVIAGPLKKYSEAEKYVLDQYIMQGGKVLWIVDGAYYSHEQLASAGYSPSMKNDVNLDDMLFNYGVRINADLLQDKQSVFTYLVSDDKDQQPIRIPSYFQPLLIPSPDHPITKNIRDVKAGFASSIDLINNSAEIKKEVLLTSSADAYLVKVPEPINFDIEHIQEDAGYFNQPFIPVAVSLEGQFNSAFSNRLVPDSIFSNNNEKLYKSRETKMIVVSSSDIITNGIQGHGEDSQIIPMGYDRVSQTQYGNRDFIVNALNWLTDDAGLMNLRTRQQQMFILNKKVSYENRDRYAVINIAFPVLFMLIVIGGAILYRKKKYE